MRCCILSTALSLTFAVFAAADSPKIGTYLVGDWSVEGTSKGKPTAGRMSVKLNGDGETLYYRWNMDVGGETRLGTAIGFVDAKTGNVVEHACVGQNHWTNTYEGILGDKIGSIGGTQLGSVEGENIEGNILVDRGSRNEFTYKVESSEGLIADLKFSRVQPGPDYAKLKSLEWMIGEWEGSQTLNTELPELGKQYKPGSQVVQHVSCQWSENRSTIIFQFEDTVDGKPGHSGLEIVSVDPASGKITHTAFSRIGGFGRGEWEAEGDVWKLTWKYTLPGGVEWTGVSIHEPIDQDSYAWQIRDFDAPDADKTNLQRMIYTRLGTPKSND